MKNSREQPSIRSKVPVALFAFNRPELTKQVIARIREYAPPIVFLVQDGARPNVASDSTSTREVRRILESVDWDCVVHRIFANKNLGLLVRFDTALKQIFTTVDRCIILEDDVLPSQDFFRFAEAALEDFRFDLRVGMVSGYCETNKSSRVLGRSLSRKPKVWGWATWSDRLLGYDPRKNEFADRNRIESFLILRRRGFSIIESIIWPARMRRALCIGTWDYQWAFHVLSKFGYSIASSTNLVTNLGFGASSTNTSLTPPFINFVAVDCNGWELDRSVPNNSLMLDRKETIRRAAKMLTPLGWMIAMKKLVGK